MDKNKRIEQASFKSYVAEIKPLVYKEIMDSIDDAERGSDPEAKEYYKIVREYPERPSGYRRPGLVMLVAEMFGVPKEDSYWIASVFQAIQEWVLVHDDVMDNSEVRSGQPTLYRKYGLAMAINVGDTLHMIANNILNEFRASAGDVGDRIASRMYRTLLRTGDGQAMDINFIGKKSIGDASIERYLHIVKEKTCRYSVMDPMVVGAMLARQPNNVITYLETIGAYAGIAFQIMDDILDMTADEVKFGKQRYGDLYEGKLTAIILYAYKEATEDERARIDRIYAKKRDKKTVKDINFLAETISKYGAVEKAVELAEHYGEFAELALIDALTILPDNKFRDIFMSAVREMYIREK